LIEQQRYFCTFKKEGTYQKVCMKKENSTNNFNRNHILEKCPVTFTMDKIGGRWKPLIIWNLQSGQKRYSDLRRSLPLISEKMLIQQLKELEQDALVIREAKPVVPPHVEYRLSEIGKEMAPILSAMAEWGIKNQAKSLAL
jgi:DNA-binding HxlR family transcriptional regulator